MIDSVIVAKVHQYLTIFWKVFTNLTSRDNNRAEAPEAFRSADIF